MIFDRMLRRWCFYVLATRFHIFKTWYKTASGEWTEEIEKADWQRWHNLPTGAFCVDTKSESYWLINGVRYDDISVALEAAEKEILRPFIPILVLDCEKILRKKQVV